MPLMSNLPFTSADAHECDVPHWLDPGHPDACDVPHWPGPVATVLPFPVPGRELSAAA